MEQSESRISDTFDASRWCEVGLEGLSDITYHRGVYPDGRPAPVVRIAFDRPQVRNAFRPETVDQLYRCLDHARCTASVAAILLTGNSPAADGGYAFCSGGDQKVRGNDGYRYETGLDPNNPATATLAATEQTEPRSSNPQPPTKPPTPAPAEDPRDVAGRLGRLHILEVQRLIRATPKPVIALVNGWATGGGHSLVMVCDLALASREHAQFKQVDANVGSFDAGYGSGLLARQAGDKKAREIFFLAQTYGAEDAERWGIVNRAVPHAQREELGWSGCRCSPAKPRAWLTGRPRRSKGGTRSCSGASAIGAISLTITEVLPEARSGGAVGATWLRPAAPPGRTGR